MKNLPPVPGSPLAEKTDLPNKKVAAAVLWRYIIIEMKTKARIFSAAVLISVFILIIGAGAFDLPKWFPFNTDSALDEWKEKMFHNRVIYEVEPKDSLTGYLSAKSEQACSGLIYKMKFNAAELPMISWQWKVAQFPDKESVAEEKPGWLEQDDYAARVYVIFPSIIFTNIKTIEYIWSEDIPEDTVMTSPYFENIKLIVIQSGRDKMGQWVREKRNIYEDYELAFGKSPNSLNVGAIALMTDADNTASTAEAFYKEIKVGYKDEE